MKNTINVNTLRTVCKAIYPLIADNHKRHALRGAQFVALKNTLIINAGDGVIASRIRIDGEFDPCEVVIPKSTIKALSTMHKATEGMRGMFHLDKGLIFGVEFTAIDERYPKTDQLFYRPEPGEEPLPSVDNGVDISLLGKVCASAKLLSHKKYRGVKVLGEQASHAPFMFEVPTSHGQLEGISLPALYVLAAMRL